MGIVSRRSGVDRHLRLVRAMAHPQEPAASPSPLSARSRVKRLAVRALVYWALISAGYIWCVAGRECDYEWPCFSATFFASVS
jgi:hypothetical protein